MQKAAESVLGKAGGEWEEIEQKPYVMEQSDLQEIRDRDVPHVEVTGKGCFVTAVVVIAVIIIIFALF